MLNDSYYDIYEHLDTGERLAFDSRETDTLPERSMRLFRKRLVSAMKVHRFRLFITFTYSDSLIPRCYRDVYSFYSSSHVRECINRIRTYARKRCIYFEYVWRLEFGSASGRPHYHMLLTLSNIDHKQLEKWWGFGYVHVAPVLNEATGVRYISKYLISKNVDDHRNRSYGTSRGIKPPLKSRWRLILSWVPEQELSQFLYEHNDSLVTIPAYFRRREL